MQATEQRTRLQGATAGQISAQQFHGGETRWGWRLVIGNRVFRSASTKPTTLNASYDAEGVGSLETVLPTNLTGYNGARVRLFVGYGDALQEWFTGKLGKPRYDPASGNTTVTALGPTGLLSRRYFDYPVRYRGVSLQRFFSGLKSRLYDDGARLEVYGGERFELADTEFGGEVSLGESATSVLESAQFVMSDRVGYVLRVEPRPRATAAAATDAVYVPGDYPEGQPEMMPSEEGPFYKVVVFRDEDGVTIVRAEARVDPEGISPPAPNEIYWVPDFEGDQELAQHSAAQTARGLAADPLIGALNGVPANPDISRHSGLMLYLDEEEAGDVLYRRGYAALVTEAQLDALAGTMDLSYEALRVESEEIPPDVVAPEIGAYTVESELFEREFPFGSDEVGLFVELDTLRAYFGEDLTGVWIDVSRILPKHADEAGEDARGIWVETGEVGASDERVIYEVADETIAEVEQ